MVDSNFDEFCENFDIVENAMEMRSLIRWNGRELRNKENLAEHTHLVVACVIHLYEICERYIPNSIKEVNYPTLIKHAMLHDSVELLRGDILSVTKDVIPGLRDAVTNEEKRFFETQDITLINIEQELIDLADLMACYKFLEHELKFPSNDYMRNAYIVSKEKFKNKLYDFAEKHGLFNWVINKEFSLGITSYEGPRFVKGYADDAGVDIILTEDIVFMPHCTTSFGLKVQITPKEGEMAFLCARTSAANKGLVVAMCPIDPNFTGEVTAIVHNVSNSIIEYKKGDSFCQFCCVNTNTINDMQIKVKKEGKRSVGKLGSTDKR